MLEFTNKSPHIDENKHQEAPKAETRKTKGMWLNNITTKSQSSPELQIMQTLIP